MEFPVSISMGGEGCLATLFAPKARKTQAVLNINPNNQTVQIMGKSALVKNVQHTFRFDELKEIEGKGPLFLVIRPKNGSPIQLKDVADLAEILNTLAPHVNDVTKDLIRKRINKFAERLGKPS